MWKETKVVKDVRHFYSFDARYGVYATTDKDDNSMLYINGKEIPIREVGYVRSYDDKVVVQVNDGAGLYDTRLYTKDGELLNVINNTISLYDNTNMHYLEICSIEAGKSTDYYNLVDVETNEVIFEENYLGTRCVFGNMIFSNENNIVTRYDWDGSILWQHNYEPDFNVKINLGFVMEGVCGGKLWVKSKHDRHEILLAIDVNTGELVRAFSDSEEDTDLPHCNYGSFKRVYLNCENDLILIIARDREGKRFMFFVDAKTLEVFEKTDYAINYDYDSGKEYVMGISGFYGDFLTLRLECLEDGNTSGFAVYNYKKKEVVFAHRLFSIKESKKGWAISNCRIPFFNNGRILVHDFANRLHIFEDVKD
ncbi:MAG: hypothetical protein J5676_13455 [Bacteroidaceae bacterium]|nr:hypothetical protein [Bacteroidaceae bacterium]